MEEQLAKTCPICGNPVPPGRPKKTKYCSQECARKANWQLQKELREQERVPKYCRVCGKEIEPKQGRSAYCSDECRDRFYNRRSNKRENCPVCGKPIPQKDKHAHWKYCSNECYLKAAQERQRLRRQELGLEKKCPVCDKIVVPDGTSRVYCSEECRVAAKRDRELAQRIGNCCRFCGNPIPENSRRKYYCSAECAEQDRMVKRAKGELKEKWNPTRESYAEYQKRTFIHPSTHKTLGESVSIAPRRHREGTP